jgi:hypothetical protein
MVGCDCKREKPKDNYKYSKKYEKPWKMKDTKKNFKIKEKDTKHKKKYKLRSSDKSRQLDMYYGHYKKREFDEVPKSELRSWDRIHKLAVNAHSDNLKEEFEKYIRYLASNFPCPRCQPHILERMLSHPIKNYYYMLDEKGRDIGLAKWSWEFHNAVNERTGKQKFSWEKFIDKYLK